MVITLRLDPDQSYSWMRIRNIVEWRACTWTWGSSGLRRSCCPPVSSCACSPPSSSPVAPPCSSSQSRAAPTCPRPSLCLPRLNKCKYCKFVRRSSSVGSASADRQARVRFSGARHPRKYSQLSLQAMRKWTLKNGDGWMWMCCIKVIEC